MNVSIEWFLADNFVMNWLVLQLASVISGLPLKSRGTWGFALFGAVYAFVAIEFMPWLLSLFPKVSVGVMMAFSMVYHRKDIFPACLGVMISACFTGGIILCLNFMFGGSYMQGVLVGSLSLRIALLGFVLCAMIPRMIRAVKKKQMDFQSQVPMKILHENKITIVHALVDSGNLLAEPISQKPIIVLRKGVLERPLEGRWPVAFSSVGGEGILYAARVQGIFLFCERWHAVDAMLAESDGVLGDHEAIIPMGLLQGERNGTDAESYQKMDDAIVSATDIISRGTAAVYTFGRNIAGTLSGRGRTGVDQTIDDGGTGSEECAD